jgi:hypothetical protein
MNQPKKGRESKIKSDDSKQVTLKKETWEHATRLGRVDDTYDDIISRCIRIAAPIILKEDLERDTKYFMLSATQQEIENEIQFANTNAKMEGQQISEFDLKQSVGHNSKKTPLKSVLPSTSTSKSEVVTKQHQQQKSDNVMTLTNQGETEIDEQSQ